MPNVTFNGNTYSCVTAYKGPDYVHLVDGDGTLVVAFDGVTDFSGFSITNGNWSTTSDKNCHLAIFGEGGAILRGKTADSAIIGTYTHGANGLTGSGENGRFKATTSGTISSIKVNGTTCSVKCGEETSIDLISGNWYTFILDGTTVNFSSGGAGAALNYKVVGDTSAPSNRSENTIWVNTSDPIKSHVFSATQPTGSDGMVWFQTTASSTVNFNALKKNVIQVYPASVKQYVSGAWVNKTAKIYQGGKWVDFARLPAEYQEVQYIETTGTQYIDTGTTPSSNDICVETQVQLTTNETNMVLFGTGAGNAYYNLTIYQSAWWYGTNGTLKSAGSITPKSGDKYTVVYNDSSHAIKINGSSIVSGITATSSSPIKIAARENTGNKFRYFYFRIINNSTNAVLKNLIPCYRRSDSAAGMYDLVGKKFYPNNGSGTFVVGGDV